jgi:hypothetical protein
MLLRLAALDPRRRGLLAAAACWVLATRMVLLVPVRSFSNKQRLLDAICVWLPRLRQCSADEAVWAMSAVARRVPGTLCLAWALALRGLLRQAGMRSELRIGVTAGEPGSLKAHAWLACAGRTLSWGDDVEGYNELRARAFAS